MFSLSAALGAQASAGSRSDLVIRWSRKAAGAAYRMDLADLGAVGAARVVVDVGGAALDAEAITMAAAARRAGLATEVVAAAEAGWDQEAARRLRDVGVAQAVVGIGLEPRPSRAQRSWDPGGRVARAVDEAQRGGLRVRVALRLTSASTRHLASLLNWVERSGVSGCDVVHVMPDDRLDWRTDLARPAQTRYALQALAAAAWRWQQRWLPKEIRTWHGPADPVFLYIWCLRHAPEQAASALAAARTKAAAWPDLAWIDSEGNVFAVTGAAGLTLGSLRQRPFSEIWLDRGLPGWQRTRALCAALATPCADCRWCELCRGGERGRALANGAMQGPDPGCCLTAREIAPVVQAG